VKKKYIVRLTDSERKDGAEVMGKLKGTGQKVRRAQVLLKCCSSVAQCGCGWSGLDGCSNCRCLFLSYQDRREYQTTIRKVVELEVVEKVSHETVRKTLKQIA